MDYIVSAEDTPYYHWQLELLIESFKRHGLQDRLLIALASGDATRSPDLSQKNLANHPRLFTFDNIGRKRGYPYLNKPYAVATAVRQDKIKQPFAVIDPDMVLFVPLRPEKEPLAFQVNPFFNVELVRQHVPDIQDHLTRISGKPDHWFPVGSVYNFNGIPSEIFNRVVSWAELLAFDSSKAQVEAKKPIVYWRYLERVGWALAFLDYLGKVPYRATHTYEMALLDHNIQHNFIHYTNGQPPVFSKHLFKFEPPVFLTGAASPFEALLSESPTTTSVYMQQIVKSYLGLA
jgi:hypothetical protein